MTKQKGLKVVVLVVRLIITPTIKGVTMTMYFNINKTIDNIIICFFCMPFLAKLKIKSLIFFEIHTTIIGKTKFITNGKIMSNRCVIKPITMLKNNAATDKMALQIAERI
jgi:hypothetical protein